MAIDPRSFRKSLGCFATGVTVITAKHPVTGDLVGVTVSAFSSLSLDPPLVLFCLGKASSSLEAFNAASHFAVNVLSETQRDVSIRFSSRSSDKWVGQKWQAGESGVPLLDGCLATLECRKVQVVDGGDHVIFMGEVEAMTHQEGGSPLIYFRGAYLDYAPPLPVAGA